MFLPCTYRNLLSISSHSSPEQVLQPSAPRCAPRFEANVPERTEVIEVMYCGNFKNSLHSLYAHCWYWAMSPLPRVLLQNHVNRLELWPCAFGASITVVALHSVASNAGYFIGKSLAGFKVNIMCRLPL